jgi:hypothetical protein
MITRSDLKQWSLELQAAWDRLGMVSESYPSIMIATRGDDGKTEYRESLAAIYELGSKRIDFLRRQFAKAESCIPKAHNIKKEPAAIDPEKKKRKPRSDAGQKRGKHGGN